jgi:hypothetical protein
VINFFLPYTISIYGAAYCVQQTLEGYGLTSSAFIEHDSVGNIIGGYWSPSEAVMVPFGLLLIYSFLLIISLLASGFVLGRWKGVLVTIFVISIPGILSVIGFWPQINYLPSSYVIHGTGYLGSPKGMIPLLVLGLASGWSFVVNVYDTLKLNNKFRNYFDHFWYCTGILAGIFFVSDSGSNNNLHNLLEENLTSRQASLYLLGQVKDYDSFCREQNIQQKISCRWASDVQQSLNEYAAYDEKIFSSLGPKTSHDIYSPLWGDLSDQDILEIRKEIKIFNDRKCPEESIGPNVTKYTRPSGECQQVPAKFCNSFPDPPEGLVDKYIVSRTVALASECIVPSLVMSRETQYKLNSISDNSSKEKHQRWLFFVLFSIVTGGKVANTSTKTFELDKRCDNDRRRIIKLVIKMFGRVRDVFMWILFTADTILRRLRQLKRPWVR